MTTILVTQQHSASIATLLSDPVGSQLSGRTPLPLASRYPAQSTPRTAVAPSGHIFLWTDSTSVVWEYDSRGRRVGEISAKCKRIKRVLGLGKVERHETAIIDDGAGLRVWRKGGTGIWEMRRTIDAGEHVADIAPDPTSKWMAIVERGRVRLCNLEGAEEPVMGLSEHLLGESAVRVCFISSSPRTLVVASECQVLQVTMNTRGEAEIVHLNEMATGKKHIVAMATPPSAPASEATSRIAICYAGGEVSVYDLSRPNPVPLNASFSDPGVCDVLFADDRILLGRTRDGRLLVLDLADPSVRPTELKVDSPIVSLSAVPLSDRSSKSVTVPSATSTVRSSSRQSKTVLGEARNVGNVQPIVQGHKSESRDVSSKSSAKGVKATRVVSAPTKQPKPQMPSTVRSASQPVAPRQPRPSSNLTQEPRVEAIEEEVEGTERPGGSNDDNQAGSEPSMYLDWALRSPDPRQPEKEEVREDHTEMAEMRREIARLQLDMLRLGRVMKSEIRKATQPLWDEVKKNRETIQRQAKEIERLSRDR